MANKRLSEEMYDTARGLHGFVPISPDRVKASAEHRAQAGYVALYPQLAKE